MITPVFDENREIIKYVGLKEDLTGLLTIQKELEETLVSLEETVNKRTLVLRSTQSLLLESLATLSEYRDNETGEHIKRTKLYVKFLVECISSSLDYTEYELVQLWSSAPLHDIGKVAIPDNILLKPDKLTDEEFDIMKMHPIHGNEALMRVSECKDDDNFLKFAKEITLFHHEKWDGSGYPYGLEGEDIPISARMMALADVYDALRSKRPYKDPIPHEKVMGMILEERGRHFDPVLVDLFIEFNGKFNDIFTNSMEEVFNFDDL
ncbi:HD domain-containing protein [Thiospirochaeta perfilievii]|uniref:HD domain-containing protein n=1 Tax=Thiospirochaeta perfilievii TaxID=252967 RepID=A0A5C1QCJ0_9SPIO|nr:HD domain-containing protein [Thiospirochaeta perfilievii]